MDKKSILLLGAGGHAKSCIDVIEQEGNWFVAGIIGLPHEVGSEVLGYPVIGSDKDLPVLLQKFSCAMVTVGHIKSPRQRIKLFGYLEENGCVAPTIKSPQAYVSSRATIGEGTIVMHGAVVNADVKIGRNCIINSQALVEHDVAIGDHCHISTAVVLNGGVVLGEKSFVGSGSCVRESVEIGQGSLIGMGQNVLKSCGKNTIIPYTRETK